MQADPLHVHPTCAAQAIWSSVLQSTPDCPDLGSSSVAHAACTTTATLMSQTIRARVFMVPPQRIEVSTLK